MSLAHWLGLFGGMITIGLTLLWIELYAQDIMVGDYHHTKNRLARWIRWTIFIICVPYGFIFVLVGFWGTVITLLIALAKGFS